MLDHRSVSPRFLLPSRSETATPAGKLRLLLVEDHADTLRVLARLLRMSGWEVATAGRLSEACDAMASPDEVPVDLVISDFTLPDGSGVDVIKMVRSHWPHARGIALSGHGGDEIRQQIRNGGFDMHLLKPVNIVTLEEAIEKLVGKFE